MSKRTTRRIFLNFAVNSGAIRAAPSLNSFGGNTGETFAHLLGTAPVYADSAGTNGAIWLTFDNVTFYQTQ